MSKKQTEKHSEIKRELYKLYLEAYLSILGNAEQYIDRIFIYDLFCGEGILENSNKSSAIIALETIKQVKAERKLNTKIKILLNDKDYSTIEPSKLKVTRIKGYVENQMSDLVNDQQIEIIYQSKDYIEVKNDVIQEIKKLNSKDRALLFVDPYGYKDVINLNDFKNFLFGEKSELILFVPSSEMHRYIPKNLKESPPPGCQALVNILNELFDRQIPNFKERTLQDFIQEVRNQLFKKLSENKLKFFGTTSFNLRTEDNKNIYSLFYFTHNVRGFERMLDTKWKLDEEAGQGWSKPSGQSTLFSQINQNDYAEKLKQFIKTSRRVSNYDLYMFSLNNEHPVPHTNDVLKQLQKDNKLEVTDENGTKIRKGSFYVNYKEAYKGKRIVYFEVKE